MGLGVRRVAACKLLWSGGWGVIGNWMESCDPGYGGDLRQLVGVASVCVCAPRVFLSSLFKFFIFF